MNIIAELSCTTNTSALCACQQEVFCLPDTHNFDQQSLFLLLSAFKVVPECTWVLFCQLLEFSTWSCYGMMMLTVSKSNLPCLEPFVSLPETATASGALHRATSHVVTGKAW